MLCFVVNMSCVQEIPKNIKKLQVELVETRREQVIQLNKIAEQINQKMASVEEDSTIGQSSDQIDKVCNYSFHTIVVCMLITFRKQLIH